MTTFLFYGMPLLAILIGGPLTLALHLRSGNAWFATQILGMLGLVAGIIVNHNWNVSGPMQAVYLTLGAAVGVGLGVLIFLGRRR